MGQNDIYNLNMSMTAYTFALLTILKTNELAREYCTKQSFNNISNMLEGPCLDSSQVGYNVVCMLWILSYHEFTYEYFEDY